MAEMKATSGFKRGFACMHEEVLTSQGKEEKGVVLQYSTGDR